MWAVVGRRGDHGGAQPYSWFETWLTWFTCFREFFKFCLLLLLARGFFAFFELTLWASGNEHKTYKTTNFQEQKKHVIFAVFLLIRFSWVVCSAVSRHVLHKSPEPSHAFQSVSIFTSETMLCFFPMKKIIISFLTIQLILRVRRPGL